jgi:REP element-mobilizing transposase RayT
MPRRPRFDHVGALFHIFNRGIARRPVFETRADIRYFLACLARAVRRGEVQVLGFTILTTHFHLLVRSPAGCVAEAMRRVLNEYVRYFNRTRKRDGALFRGRYGARRVTSLRYLWILVRYIDANAVRARLAATPEEYPYCSAWHYARSRRPKWLLADFLEDALRARGWSDVREGYRTSFASPPTAGERAILARRLRRRCTEEDPLDDLLAAAPAAVVSWMRRKTALADRTLPGPACVDARSVLDEVAAGRTGSQPWTCVTAAGRSIDAWPAATVLLLRHVAGLTIAEIARTLGISDGRARQRAQQGADLLQSEAFAAPFGMLARRVLERSHGGAAYRKESDSVR